VAGHHICKPFSPRDLALPDDTAVIDRSIDSDVKNIGAKVKAVSPDWNPIRSVYGVGYAFET
jgi:two-component system, OmpR family, response regulator BaeR